MNQRKLHIQYWNTMDEDVKSFVDSKDYLSCDNFSDREKMIITMRFFEGLTYVDIARKLDRSPASIRTRCLQLLTKLKSYSLKITPETLIEHVPLSIRAKSCLSQVGCLVVRDIDGISSASLKRIRNSGNMNIVEIQEFISSFGFSLKLDHNNSGEQLKKKTKLDIRLDELMDGIEYIKNLLNVKKASDKDTHHS